MDRWLAAALDYIPRWIDFQMQVSQQPGCIIAIAHRGNVVLERAFGTANLGTGEALTPRHRFRVASHSKSFTAAGIMKLREQRRLKLDDAAGDYLDGLHPDVARATIAQLLSHTAGIIRDGEDAGQFVDRRPYLNEAELRAELKLPLVIAPGTRMKYSNHGFGLLGLIIKAITGEPYATWIKREIVDAAGLKETTPDMPLRRGTPFARGHTGRILLGRRLVIPGDNPCNAIDAAGGFVSTAADIARYFAQLAPNARSSIISAASRREMTRRHWRNPHNSLEQYYGLGTISGSFFGWDWFGHSGGLQGYISRTCVYPQPRAHRLRAHQRARRLGASVGRWRRQHHADLPAQRRAIAQGEGLERALLEPVGGTRSRADGQQGAGGGARLHQSDDRRERA